VSCWA